LCWWLRLAKDVRYLSEVQKVWPDSVRGLDVCFAMGHEVTSKRTFIDPAHFLGLEDEFY